MIQVPVKEYAAYRETGLDWLPRIPSHWQLRRAKYLLEEVGQRSVSGTETLLSLSKNRGVIPRDNLDERAGQAESLVGYKVVEPDNIVINRMQAANGLIAVSNVSGITSPDYGIYRSARESEIDPHVVGQLLRQPEYQGEIKRRVTGVMEGFIRLYTNELFEIPLILAPLSEQKSISRFVKNASAKIEAAIALEERQIALLKERKQIVIQNAVTKGLNPNVPMIDSGVDWIGDIPAHWNVQPIRALFGFRNEKNDPVKTEDILSLSIAQGVTPYTEEGRGGNKRKDDLTAYKLAYPGDIVLNSMNVIVGAVGLSKYFGAISPVYYALYPKNTNKNIEYFAKIFSNAGFQRGLLRLGKGIMMKLSSTGQLNTIRMKISSNDLKCIQFPSPPDDECAEIAKYIADEEARIDGGIALKEDQIAMLMEYKATLINSAVTGKIKVA